MKIDELENAVARIIDDAKSGRADPAWSGVRNALRSGRPDHAGLTFALLARFGKPESGGPGAVADP